MARLPALLRAVVPQRHPGSQLQEWGREGQRQQGIDLFGFRDRDPKQPVGIQCKRIEEPITEKTIRAEIEKARKLRPGLTELIFATTSDRDVGIQAVAAQITQELHDTGWPCRIAVMGWQDLRLEIPKYLDALDAFSPSGRVFEQPTLQAVRQTGASIHAKMDAHTALIMEKLEGLSRSQTLFHDEYDAELEPEAKSEPGGLHHEITTYRNLIRKGQTKIALEELYTAPHARPAALCTLPDSLEHLGDPSERREVRASARFFAAGARRAARRREGAHQSRVRGAGQRRPGHRRTVAEAILAEHPTHGPAASVLLQARARDKSVSDPFALVPAGVHGTPDFKIGAVVFLRQHDDASWRKVALEAAATHPDNEVLKRFAAEAELEPILNDPEAMLGKEVGGDVIATVTRCAAVLKEVWAKEIAAEQANREEIIPLAANLASALRYAGDDASAADVLDQTIARAGKDPILLRARALLYLHADDDRKAVELLTEGRTIPRPGSSRRKSWHRKIPTARSNDLKGSTRSHCLNTCGLWSLRYARKSQTSGRILTC